MKYTLISIKERQEVGKNRTTVYFQSKDILEVLGTIYLSQLYKNKLNSCEAVHRPHN